MTTEQLKTISRADLHKAKLLWDELSRLEDKYELGRAELYDMTFEPMDMKMQLSEQIEYTKEFLKRWDQAVDGLADLKDLTEEFQKFCTDNELPQWSADELLNNMVGTFIETVW